MCGLEKFLGVSYEGFEHEVLELFSAMESSRKDHRNIGFLKKRVGD
jgi:hypothetical protein